MKYTIEEIKGLLEGITQGEWSFEDNEMCIEGVPICTFFTAEDFPCVPIEDEPKLEEELKRLKSFIAAASTIIRDLLAEVERLKIENTKLSEQLNYYNMAFRGRQELSLAAWAQKTIKELQDQLQAAQALAAQHLADQELLVVRERKRVARECAEIIERHLKSIGKVKDPYELGAKMACVTIRDVIRERYGVEE